MSDQINIPDTIGGGPRQEAGPRCPCGSKWLYRDNAFTRVICTDYGHVYRKIKGVWTRSHEKLNHLERLTVGIHEGQKHGLDVE